MCTMFHNHRHCEKRSDEAIQSCLPKHLDCFAVLAMTNVLLEWRA